MEKAVLKQRLFQGSLFALQGHILKKLVMSLSKSNSFIYLDSRGSLLHLFVR